MHRWDEELTARLRPLESIFKRLPVTQRLDLRLKLWKSGEHRLKQTCRHAQCMVLVVFRTRAEWRLKRVNEATTVTLAEMTRSIICRHHRNNKKEIDDCAWI
jgi:hypothetical protein